MNKFTVSGDEVRVSIPFTKVDRERRIVSGFATIDNVDNHGDVITAEATRKAFASWIGNLREMHAPKAVGKVVDFQEQEITVDGEKYTGMYVSAYISTGAPDTWEKVVDGTLSGFSIGGRALKKGTAHKDDGSTYNVIKEYQLFELSLVDNPANPLARVISIEKMDGITKYEGMAVDTKVLNVHYNHNDNVIVLSAEESKDGYENIGWVEDSPSKDDAVKKAVDDYVKSIQDPKALESKLEEVYRAWYKRDRDESEGYTALAGVYSNYILIQNSDGEYKKVPYSRTQNGISFKEPEDVDVQVTITEKSFEGNLSKVDSPESSTLSDESKGGADVANEKETQEEVEEVEATEENEESTEEETQKAADLNEVQPEPELDVDAISKAVSEQVAEFVKEVAAQSKEEVQETRASFEEALEDLKKSVEEKVSGLEENFKNLEEQVDSLQDGTAVKKSLDVGADNDEDDEDDNDNFWRGSGFLSANSITTG